MGNQIQNLNNLSEDKIIKEEKIIKATINSTISLTQSKILINESEFQSISNNSKNNKNNDTPIKEKFYLLNKSRCKITENNNKIIKNSHIDNNKTYIINKLYKNINYNNNNGCCYLNLENDSKFINFDVVNDNSELYDLSKIEDEKLLNEKENKDINEYEFEEYITKLNSNNGNINIDKQLNERPLFSPFIFMLNSDKIDRKDSRRMNNDNNISKIIKNKINKRNKKKEYFNGLKMNKNNKAVKIYETTQSLYDNKNKYYDYQSINQRPKSKSKNINEKTVSSNTYITNIDNNNHLNYSSRQKNILYVGFNKINSDNNMFQYNKRIKTTKNEYLNKVKIKQNLNLPKINKKRIEFDKKISPKNCVFEKKEERNKCLSNKTGKIKRILTERSNINEFIKINNLTNLILGRNNTKFRKLKKNIHISLSQTFDIKKPLDNYKSCSFVNNNEDKKNKNKNSKIFNKYNSNSRKDVQTKRNIKNLKLTNSCSNLFSRYNKLIYTKKNRNLSNKRENKISTNYINLNYYKMSPTPQFYKNKKGKENN